MHNATCWARGQQDKRPCQSKAASSHLQAAAHAALKAGQKLRIHSSRRGKSYNVQQLCEKAQRRAVDTPPRLHEQGCRAGEGQAGQHNGGQGDLSMQASAKCMRGRQLEMDVIQAAHTLAVQTHFPAALAPHLFREQRDQRCVRQAERVQPPVKVGWGFRMGGGLNKAPACVLQAAQKRGCVTSAATQGQNQAQQLHCPPVPGSLSEGDFPLLVLLSLSQAPPHAMHAHGLVENGVHQGVPAAGRQTAQGTPSM